MVDTARFLASHLFAVGLILFPAYLAGAAAVRLSVGPQQEEGRLFLYTSVGLGGVISMLFWVALVGLLYPAAVAALLAAPPLYFLARRDPGPLSPAMPGPRKAAWSAGIAAALLVPALLLPLYPPHRWDELSYHLAYARFYVDNHSLAVNQFLRYPLYAHNINLLYTPALLFFDDIVAHLLHAAAGCLTALGIYHLGKQTYDARVGIVASVVFLTSDIVSIMMMTSYIDLGLTLFVFLAFFSVSRWSMSRNPGWLVLAGFAAGIAAGSKYSGLFYAALFTVWVVAETRKPALVLKFLVPLVVFGSPWYVRNFFLSGDPIHPFGGEFFGFWLWDRSDLAGQAADMAKYGAAKTVENFLKLPWDLLVNPARYQEGTLSPGIVGFFPSLFFLPAMSGFYRKAAAFAAVNLVAWFLGAQVLRYLLPVLPVVALLSAFFFVKIWDAGLGRFSGRLSAKVATALGVFPVVAALAGMLLFDARVLDDVRNLPVPATEQSRQDFLEAVSPAYPLLKLAARTPELPVYQLGFEDSYYFARNRMMGDWFGPARYAKVTGAMNDPAALHKALAAMNARIFIVNKTRFPFAYDPRYDAYFQKMVDTPENGFYLVK